MTGNLKYCDTVGFLARNGINYNYDADGKKMVVGVPVAGESIDTFYTKVGTKKYIATNAFGAKAKVTATEYLTFSVSMRRDEPKEKNEDGSFKPKHEKYELHASEFYREPRTIELDVPMSPDEAKELKVYGGIVIIGKLYKPFIDKYISHSKPTISKPTETIDDIRYVVIDPSEIWVVNTKSGKIYSRVKVDLQVHERSRNKFITKPFNAPAVN